MRLARLQQQAWAGCWSAQRVPQPLAAAAQGGGGGGFARRAALHAAVPSHDLTGHTCAVCGWSGKPGLWRHSSQGSAAVGVRFTACRALDRAAETPGKPTEPRMGARGVAGACMKPRARGALHSLTRAPPHFGALSLTRTPTVINCSALADCRGPPGAQTPWPPENPLPWPPNGDLQLQAQAGGRWGAHHRPPEPLQAPAVQQPAPALLPRRRARGPRRRPPLAPGPGRRCPGGQPALPDVAGAGAPASRPEPAAARAAGGAGVWGGGWRPGAARRCPRAAAARLAGCAPTAACLFHRRHANGSCRQPQSCHIPLSAPLERACRAAWTTAPS